MTPQRVSGFAATPGAFVPAPERGRWARCSTAGVRLVTTWRTVDCCSRCFVRPALPRGPTPSVASSWACAPSRAGSCSICRTNASRLDVQGERQVRTEVLFDKRQRRVERESFVDVDPAEAEGLAGGDEPRVQQKVALAQVGAGSIGIARLVIESRGAMLARGTNAIAHRRSRHQEDGLL